MFGDRRDGFFVEAGAYDGQFDSGGLHLERKLGWQGVLVEPNREAFRKVPVL
jgi:hypothetical protein